MKYGQNHAIAHLYKYNFIPLIPIRRTAHTTFADLVTPTAWSEEYFTKITQNHYSKVPALCLAVFTSSLTALLWLLLKLSFETVSEGKGD